MRTSRINYDPRPMRFTPYQGESTEVLLESVRLSMSFLERLGEDERITKVREYATRMCMNFVKSFTNNMRKELGKASYQQFHDESKARANDLGDLRAQLSRLSNIEGLFYIPRGSDEALDIRSVQYFGKGGKFVAVCDEDVLIAGTIRVPPYWYGSLFKAMYSTMSLFAELMEEKDDLGAETVMQIALQVESWGGLYNELRSNKPMTLEFEKEIFSALSESESQPLSDDVELLDLFNQVRNDVIQGDLPYVEEFSNALRNAQRPEVGQSFKTTDYYVSGKSSSYRHTKGFMRISIISSGVETDPFRNQTSMDDVIDYHSYYNMEYRGDGKPHPFITMSIIQNKIKPRVIHIAANAIQDRCKYIFRILQTMLTGLRTDCINDQRRGIAFAEYVSNPKYREQHGYPSILCMDFSNATDLLSQEFQEECLRMVFPEAIVQFWGSLSRYKKVFKFSDESELEYIQLRGQPQGLLGSIHAFAVAHHVIMLMTMRHCHLEMYRASQFYRILGDDSIISSITSDPNDEVQSAYCRICAWAGLEINLRKSHIVTFRDKVGALCEFAKVRVLNGRMSSPVPIRLLSRVGKTTGLYSRNYYKLTTLMWMAVNGYDYLREDIHRFLPEMFDDEDIEIASDLLRAGVIPAFRMFADYQPRNRIELDKAMFCYLIERLKGTFFKRPFKG